ncbi:uncharacterized protein LACBIDRAFT_300066 [Laccaria bicolor S238N-H82]|uniref:Predicted protein n=1 Tax=Laccaria bicolor (strain S238N-H82 / ATCC MYA-4686) TaxID=486041 RepID=B0DFY6_LACBS|nr:uncharacterized protein LACBIDRAFT_300066 [Laccaria bicolor S238N-H82]EDR06544.1 predicted protein [Laccaria bicolor S238N-H82]|eukprot:XP_001882916.1 predicted protein [Laccaria bicolor S238N-H82]
MRLTRRVVRLLQFGFRSSSHLPCQLRWTGRELKARSAFTHLVYHISLCILHQHIAQ